MPKTQRHWVAAGLVWALAACAPTAQEQHPGFVQPAASEESTIVVQNSYFGDMDIYAVTGSTRWRIGSVTNGATAKLVIPRALLARPEIQLQVDPVGPEEPFTFPGISIRPGATIELMLLNMLQTSHQAVTW
ncbi:MAG: hypothetical protein ACT4O1_12905 [Gemmatimonadota bacterium]